MDPLPNQPVSQSIAQQPVIVAQQPTAPEKKSGNTFNKILLALVVVILIAGVGCGGYYLGTKQSNSSMQQSAKPIVTLVPTATPTPDPTASWSTYTNDKYGYSVKYPSALTTHEDNTYYHYVDFKTPSNEPVLPTFLTAVISDTFNAKDIAVYNYMSSDFINLFSTMQNGQSTTSGGATFTKLPDTIVNGQSALTIEVATGTYKQHRVYVKSNGNIYMISNSYTTPEELNNFALFLSTFKLTK